MAVTKIDSKKIPVKAPAKKRGRPAGSTAKPVNWEQLAKKLQRALAAEIKHGDAMEYEVSVLREHIENLENRGWLSRLFNLK